MPDEYSYICLEDYGLTGLLPPNYRKWLADYAAQRPGSGISAIKI